jgi:hypothetical protein
MTDQNLMDPSEFADRLNASFGLEPPHAATDADLALGRRRLRRHRATVALGGLAVAAMVSGAALAAPGVLPGAGSQEGGYAAAGEEISAQEIVATCMRKENVMHVDEKGHSISEEAALELMGEPELMTSAVTDNRAHATLLSEDKKYWGECQFARHPDNGVKNAMSVFSTGVGFDRRTVDGVKAYEPANDADPRLVDNGDPKVPDFETPCVSPLTDEERWAFDAKCPEFTMTWNDRRPADVAAVKVVTPDGEASWADVREGYLSFAYTGDMTPEIAAQVARGEAPGAKRVVLYDSSGDVLVDDRDPGDVPASGDLSILNYPSLAWWTKATP